MAVTVYEVRQRLRRRDKWEPKHAFSGANKRSCGGAEKKKNKH